MALTTIDFLPKDLVPSSRAYTPGTFPRTRYESQDGVATFIQYGNRRVNASLQLEFRNIFDVQAKDIIDLYDRAMSGEETRINFSRSEVFGGISDAKREGSQSLKTEMETGGDDLCWLFTGPPQVRSIRPGVSTVSCSFTGYVLQASIG